MSDANLAAMLPCLMASSMAAGATDYPLLVRLLALDAHRRVREAAFGLIVVRHRPADLDDVAEASGINDLAPILEALTEAGWVDRGIDGTLSARGKPR